MCGIAGYSLSPDSSVDRTLTAQALLAGSRNEARTPSGTPTGTPEKASPPWSSSARRPAACSSGSTCPSGSPRRSIHVRDYTKGHPSIPANNHPVRHGPVVGIHNGIIVNDDEILCKFDCARSEPRMTVDTEAIMALAAHSRADARAFEQLRGSMATAWFDERAPDVLYVARGAHRPLWIGRT